MIGLPTAAEPKALLLRGQRTGPVLAISHARDEHTAAVFAELGRQGVPCEVLDLADFPQRAGLTIRYGKERAPEVGFRRSDGSTIDPRSARAIWWRRPQPLTIDPAVRRESHRQFALSESHEAVSGLWSCLEVPWVNPPWCDERAHRKAYQLQVAASVGLAIPRTLISNEPEEVRAFVAERAPRPVVYKAFSATAQEWRETRLLRPEELALLDTARYAPTIFQEYVEAEYDLRITVVGTALFPAAIHARETDYEVDCRMDIGRARIEAVELPADVVRGLQRLMSALGLVYGAVDMRRTPQGRYVFLEVNPAGQWLFVEARTGQPITRQVAASLAGAGQ